ncbi:MAG TPA: hypothetical protein VFE51_17225 [Verrucomicrobiae bacterium]|nr:hypothetical protein [Verrucomicrobiae bacterium]
MSQVLDDGRVIAFGQSLEEAEQLFGCKAVDIQLPPKLARQGIDKTLEAENVSLRFDSGKLKDIKFDGGYEFKHPLTPYPEPWKNFSAIDSAKISRRMSRDDFLAYLKVWEERAKSLGTRAVEPGEDLGAQQYAVGIVQDPFADMIVVNMGPSRRAGGGGLWCDGWCLFFTTEADREKSGVEVGRLQSISAFRDEFNTVARRIPSKAS